MKYEAILALHNESNPNTGLSIQGSVEELTGLENVKSNNKSPTFTWNEVLTKEKELQAEYDALDYSRKRQAEYPSIQECVHAILDDDLTALQEKRQAVKTKYPKS